jgi:hypothetical protein
MSTIGSSCVNEAALDVFHSCGRAITGRR